MSSKQRNGPVRFLGAVCFRSVFRIVRSEYERQSKMQAASERDTAVREPKFFDFFLDSVVNKRERRPDAARRSSHVCCPSFVRGFRGLCLYCFFTSFRKGVCRRPPASFSSICEPSLGGRCYVSCQGTSQQQIRAPKQGGNARNFFFWSHFSTMNLQSFRKIWIKNNQMHQQKATKNCWLRERRRKCGYTDSKRCANWGALLWTAWGATAIVPPASNFLLGGYI